jgi:hypothetical protein
VRFTQNQVLTAASTTFNSTCFTSISDNAFTCAMTHCIQTFFLHVINPFLYIACIFAIRLHCDSLFVLHKHRVMRHTHHICAYLTLLRRQPVLCWYSSDSRLPHIQCASPLPFQLAPPNRRNWRKLGGKHDTRTSTPRSPHIISEYQVLRYFPGHFHRRRAAAAGPMRRVHADARAGLRLCSVAGAETAAIHRVLLVISCIQ